VQTGSVEHTRSEVADAYRSVGRLRTYIPLVLLASLLFFLANLGGMIVGWLPIDVGFLGLLAAALTATATAGKLLESVHRTTIYAMELERSIPGDHDLNSSSVGTQSARVVTTIALLTSLAIGAGILGYSIANADTQQAVTDLSQVFVPAEDRDDDEDENEDGDDDDPNENDEPQEPEGEGESPDSDSSGGESDSDTGTDSDEDGEGNEQGDD